MPGQTDKFTVGDYWLDKRRDGKSPHWQITWYDPATRQVRYRSTGCERLDDAKARIHAYVSEQLSQRPQTNEDARVIPQLINFWKEAGREKINSTQTEISLKLFIGFLMQDRVGMNAAVADLTPVVFERFRKWRMKPHKCDTPWTDGDWVLKSSGVVGATVDRNLNDIRSALNHAQDNLRIPIAPKVKALPAKYRSKPRDRVLTIEELGAIAWYAAHSPDMLRFVTLQLATGVRPQAALRFDPDVQFDKRFGLIDLQPHEAPQTKKRNAIIPAIRPLRPILKAWAKEGAHPVASRKTAWRIMRRVLSLDADIHPKTIRHTVATILYNDETVPEREVSELLGHEGKLARTTRIYAKYDPTRLKAATRALERLWLQVSREARRLAAVQLLSTRNSDGTFSLAEIRPKS